MNNWEEMERALMALGVSDSSAMRALDRARALRRSISDIDAELATLASSKATDQSSNRINLENGSSDPPVASVASHGYADEVELAQEPDVGFDEAETRSLERALDSSDFDAASNVDDDFSTPTLDAIALEPIEEGSVLIEKEPEN